MGQFYQDLDRAGGFDYQLWSPSARRHGQFRGPPIDLDKPFVAFVGAAQMLGRFVERPVSTLLSERLGIPVLNIAVGAAGPRHFDQPQYLDLLNRAEAIVVQVLSGRSVSCSLFDNSGEGKHNGFTPLAPGRVRAEEFLALAAKSLAPPDFARIVTEMRADYVERFLGLLEKLTPPRLLFWFSTRRPEDGGDGTAPTQALASGFPQHVNRRMIAEIVPSCEDYVEVVSNAGLPQPLWKASEPIAGARLEGDTLFNHYYPSPQMHRLAADALEAPLRRLAGRMPTRASSGGRFVILACPRTGTNLLLSMLRAHPECSCGGELFNLVEIANDRLAWLGLPEAELPQLLEKRRADPTALLEDLFERGFAAGRRAVGFKLMYRQALHHRALLEALAADTSLKVIHITRRNLLRRAVSEAQATISQNWTIAGGGEMPEMPVVRLDAATLVESIAVTQDRQTMFAQMFAAHDTLNIVYEDLAAQPSRVAARAAHFLGLAPYQTPATSTLRKTGAEALPDVVENFEALRGRFRRWAAFFDR